MEIQTHTSGTAIYNQAEFQQIRLHELFTRIDRCNADPLALNRDFQCFNYEIIFNDLMSCFSTISAKLSVEEKQQMIEKQNTISQKIINSPIQKPMINYLGQTKNSRSFQAWVEISFEFQKFRMDIETLMDKYGIGNPSKKDPTKASVNL